MDASALLSGPRTPRNWRLLLTIKGGHRYFEEVGTGKIAVADASGAYPHQTDDGTLWLDTAEPIVVHLGSFAEHQTVSIPLLKINGERCWTCETLEGTFEVCKTFGMTMRLARDETERSEVARVMLTALNDELRRHREERERKDTERMVGALKDVADAAARLYHEADGKGGNIVVSPSSFQALGETLNTIGKRRFSVEVEQDPLESRTK